MSFRIVSTHQNGELPNNAAIDIESNDFSNTSDFDRNQKDNNIKDDGQNSEIVSESSLDYDPFELASIVALTDFGSYMVKKVGKAGESPDKDQLPYFASMKRRWYFLIWEGEPEDWRMVSTRERVDDPYSHDFRSEETPLYLKDMTEIYLEPPPNLGIRLYREEEVIQLSPISYSKAEAAAWADAFRAAFSLQDMPLEISHNIRQRYYELLSHQSAMPPSGRRHSRELVAFSEVDEEIILGGEAASPKSQSGRELIEPEPAPEAVGCFGRWFGKKKSSSDS